MPTRRALLILAVASALPAVAEMNRLALYAAILVDVATLTLVALDRRQLPPADAVRMTRHHRRVFSLAEPNAVRLDLEDSSGHALRGLIQDNPPEALRCRPDPLPVRVPPRSRATLQYSLVPLERGEFRFHPAVLRAEGPLRLACRHYRLPGGEDTRFTVYPTLGSATPRQVAAFARHAETGYHRLQREVEGTTPAQVRHWAPGDNYRDVNWKATARHDRPMVTQYDADRNQTVYVFVDCGRLMRTPVGRLRKLDYAIGSCAALARVAVVDARADGFGRVDDNGYAVRITESAEACHVHALAAQVRGDDGLGQAAPPRGGGKLLLEESAVHVPGAAIGIDEDGRRSLVDDGIHAADEGERRGEHHVAGAHVEAAQRQVEGRRAACGRKRVGCADDPGELLIEGIQVRAHRGDEVALECFLEESPLLAAEVRRGEENPSRRRFLLHSSFRSPH